MSRAVTLRSFASGHVSPEKVKSFVLEKLLEQGHPSFAGTTCLYRGNGGDKCAAGHLLPDKDYDCFSMEAQTIDSVIHNLGIKMSKDKEKFIMSLQSAHDSIAFHFYDTDTDINSELCESKFREYIKKAFDRVEFGYLSLREDFNDLF